MLMGKLEDRHRFTVVRRLCGQLSRGPSGVVDQSRERMSAPISPPPTSQLSASVSVRLAGGFSEIRAEEVIVTPSLVRRSGGLLEIVSVWLLMGQCDGTRKGPRGVHPFQAYHAGVTPREHRVDPLGGPPRSERT